MLHVGTLTPREFTVDDTELLRLAADRAALAIDRARLFEERRVRRGAAAHAAARPLPQLPGLDLGASYQPAAPGPTWAATGTTSSRSRVAQIGVAIGDVVGHGVGRVGADGAAARLRCGPTRSTANSPAAVAERLNHLLLPLRPRR